MKKTTALLSVLLFCAQAWATPAQVVIIRHAEKPAIGNELNFEGCERAYLLPHFFLKNAVVQRYKNPVAIYAMQPKDKEGSIRAIQTLAPTAAQLNLTIRNTHKKENFQEMIQEILNKPEYNKKTVLIAWEHKNIPILAEAFGLKLDSNTDNWPGIVYDQAWVIGFKTSSNTSPEPSLSIMPEDLLPTDNPLGGSKWQDGPQKSNEQTNKVPSDIIKICQTNDKLNALSHKLSQIPF